MSDAALLTRFFRRPTSLAPSEVSTIRASKLSGYAYARLPETHPAKPLLRSDVLTLTTRHSVIASELHELLRAWISEGIPVMLTKGFALAQFDYTHPSERFYGDVDVVLPDDLSVVMRAVHLALARGWRTDGQHAEPSVWTHESAHLFSPSGHTRIDVHRYVLSWITGAGTRYRVTRITQDVWHRSQEQSWEGIRIRRPAPLDQAVTTLILARTWGGDAGGLKSADYTDLQLLGVKYGLTPADLLHRAAELGGRKTCQAFLSLCNPWTGTFATNGVNTQRTLLRAAAWESKSQASQALDRWLFRFKALPARLVWMPRVLPDVHAAYQLLWHPELEQEYLAEWPVSTGRKLSYANRRQLVAAFNWWLHLLRPLTPRRTRSFFRAYALYRALRRSGELVWFVKGRHRETGVLRAWLEDAHGVMEWYGKPQLRQEHQEVFRWPQV